MAVPMVTAPTIINGRIIIIIKATCHPKMSAMTNPPKKAHQLINELPNLSLSASISFSASEDMDVGRAAISLVSNHDTSWCSTALKYRLRKCDAWASAKILKEANCMAENTAAPTPTSVMLRQAFLNSGMRSPSAATASIKSPKKRHRSGCPKPLPMAPMWPRCARSNSDGLAKENTFLRGTLVSFFAIVLVVESGLEVVSMPCSKLSAGVPAPFPSIAELCDYEHSYRPGA
mmetsp:Transcript_33964/g.79422  ORF Transcript_33964/g.79422 Transcript_33964/m.79422 type:complete len:232 (-) Transcript_33964:118-813(-)